MTRKKSRFIERSIMGALLFLKESIFADEYAARRGFLQARDPRIKFLSVMFFLLAILFSKNICFMVAMYGFCLVLAVCSSIGLGFFLKRTWAFIPVFSLFIALPALLNIFTPGEPVFSFKVFTYSLSVTRQGFASAGFFFMRVLTSVSLCVLLVLTTRHYILLKVLRTFKVPQVFVMTLGMCYRYVYLFIDIIQNTYLAIKSRIGSVSSVKGGQVLVAWNISSLWQRSYQLNEEVYQAMLSRGYRGEPAVLNDFKAKAADWLWLFAAVLIAGSGYLWVI